MANSCDCSMATRRLVRSTKALTALALPSPLMRSSAQEIDGLDLWRTHVGNLAPAAFALLRGTGLLRCSSRLMVLCERYSFRAMARTL